MSDNLNEVLARINKKYGKNTIYKIKDAEKIQVDSIPTGIKTLDYALGCGGIPKGRIIEAFGSEGSGKSSLAALICAQAQRQGDIAAYIDVEQAVNFGYFKQLGVDIDNLVFSQPDSGEEALDTLKQLVESNAVGVIVIDSVSSLTPKSELAGEIGDTHVALQARMMSQAMRILTAAINNNNVAVVFINQTRMNISTTGYGGGGEVTSGGKALKFAASMRIEIKRTEFIRKGDEVIGQKVKIKTVKNKFAAPYRVVDLEFIFGKGFSTEGMLIDMAMNAGLITRAGAWYSYRGERVGQGKDSIVQKLNEDKNFATQLEAEVDEFIKTGKIEMPTERTGDED